MGKAKGLQYVYRFIKAVLMVFWCACGCGPASLYSCDVHPARDDTILLIYILYTVDSTLFVLVHSDVRR